MFVGRRLSQLGGYTPAEYASLALKTNEGYVSAMSRVIWSRTIANERANTKGVTQSKGKPEAEPTVEGPELPDDAKEMDALWGTTGRGPQVLASEVPGGGHRWRLAILA